MNDSALVDFAPPATVVPTHGAVAFPSTSPHPPRRRRWPVIAVLVLAILAGAFLVGELPRRQRVAALAAAAGARGAAPLRVRVGTPRPGPAAETVHLPGSVEAARATGVYARVGGPVLKRLVDIGQTVSAGQVLAEIDASDAVQQLARESGLLAQAQADAAQARVAQARAGADLVRAQQLGAGVITQQDLDHRQSEREAAQAAVLSAEARVTAEQAEVARLRLLAGYATVTAPFAGTITARSVEVGNLVPPGGGTAALFQIAQLEPLRVVVEVPQSVVAGLEPGATVAVTAGPGGATASGTVVRLARALDPAKRSMRAEVELPPGTTRFAPGMYVQATLSVPQQRRLLVIGADAILLSAKGTQVAVVDNEERVHLVAVTVASDTGAEVQISSGLAAGDRVVLNPGGTIAEGARVQVVVPPAAPATAPAAPASAGAARAAAPEPSPAAPPPASATASPAKSP